MSQHADLHLILSDVLHTDELSLEHDTVVVSPELTRLVSEAISGCASRCHDGSGTARADLPVAAS